MNLVRKLFVGFLSLLLLGSLLGMALSTSNKVALSHPAKIKTWINQSNLYGSFVSSTIAQGKLSVGSVAQSGTVSLSDAAVQQAANSAFSSTTLNQYTDTFIDSNYAWLEGKTKTPNFVVDLTAAKQSFAEQVGEFVRMHLASLPACTPAQLAQLQSLDPLTITCLPPGVNAQTVASQVTQQIATSDDFLSNPVITAKTINPEKDSQNSPYYEKFSELPKLYRLSLKLPLVFAGLALLCILGVVFLAVRKRTGLRHVGIIVLLAGAILVVLKFTSDRAFDRLENRIFNESTNGQLQHALTDFLHRVQTELIKIDLLFGIAFLVVAVGIFILLVSTRNRNAGPTAPEVVAVNKPTPDTILTDPSAKPTAAPPPRLKKPSPPKKPRLIQ